MLPSERCLAKSRRRPLRDRSVDISKGNDDVEMYKGLGMQLGSFKVLHGEAFRERLLAARPPMESLRLMLSHTMGKKKKENGYAQDNVHRNLQKRICIQTDWTRTFFYVDLPKEMVLGNRRTQDVSEAEHTKMFVSGGFHRGSVQSMLVSPQEQKDARASVHGNDFTISGMEPELRWIADVFKSKRTTKSPWYHGA